MQPFHDLRAQYEAHRGEIDAAVARVLASGTYVLGPEVERFEEAFAAYLGVRHVVGVASGTAALELALRVLGVGPGDEVVLPALTAPPTAMAVCNLGATPRLADVEAETLTLSVDSLAAELGPAVKAVLPVHLYGQCADMDAICELADGHGVPVVEDAAQAHGAGLGGRPAGTLGRLGCFSFYPTKNLGAYGDAGAVATDDAALAGRLRALRNYGRRDEHDFDEPGPNERLDPLQAAVLGAKLPHLDAWNERRAAHAKRYRQALAGAGLRLPAERPGGRHAHHQFVVRSERRDALREHLERQGVATAIHYPAALHRIEALRGRCRFTAPPREAERAAQTVLSLPIYPELPPEHQERVIEAVLGFD